MKDLDKFFLFKLWNWPHPGRKGLFFGLQITFVVPFLTVRWRHVWFFHAWIQNKVAFSDKNLKTKIVFVKTKRNGRRKTFICDRSKIQCWASPCGKITWNWRMIKDKKPKKFWASKIECWASRKVTWIWPKKSKKFWINSVKLTHFRGPKSRRSFEQFLVEKFREIDAF